MEMMKKKSLRLPAIILAVGLILSLVACLLTTVTRTPAVTEQEFRYSVTYRLDGETKVLEGIYKCSFEGYSEGEDPRYRYYTEEYIVDGQATFGHSYTIKEKDGAELYIVTIFDSCYLMGDTQNVNYESDLEDPWLEAVDREGIPYDDTNMPKEFEAEILDWEYPEPIKNKFVFSGFSLMHTASMLVMLLISLLVILACMIFVKRDEGVSYRILDKLSIPLNFVACLVAIPFITIVTAFLPLTVNCDSFFYQMFLCLPALTAFTVAASIALRRKGFCKSGFFVQLVGPAIFFLSVFLETILTLTIW